MDTEGLRKIAELDQDTGAALIAAESMAQTLGRFRKELTKQGFTRAEAMELVNQLLTTNLYTAAETQRLQMGLRDHDES